MFGARNGFLLAPQTLPAYVEDVFSTWLTTGTDSTLIVNNGIDLAGKGGLVWQKGRNSVVGATSNTLFDTARGVNQLLQSNSTSAQINASGTLPAFNSNGFEIGSNNNLYVSGQTGVSWTFRKQAKFFDVVTGTGPGTFNHSLGVTPAMIIIKDAGATGEWYVVHRSSNGYFVLNTTAAAASTFLPGIASTGAWVDANSTTFNNSQFISSGPWVAYLFAHNAGGFGLTGTDNVISCGSFTTDGSGRIPDVNLGYEPQWIIAKPSSGTGNWFINDTLRGWFNQSAGESNSLFPNLANAEAVGYNSMIPTATGFTGPNVNFGAGVTYIYMAIRRGPMKTPTSGTSVFQPVRYAGATNTFQTISTGKTFATDWLMTWDTDNGAFGTNTGYSCPGITRLAGFGVNPPYLRSTNGTAAEYNSVVTITLNNSNYDYRVGGFSGNLNSTGSNYTHWNFGRAPGFFDVVCYTGNDIAGATQAHNLNAVPEIMIVKSRSAGSTNWRVYTATTGNGNELIMNTTDASGATTNWNSTTPTSSVFSLGGGASVNASGTTYVAYLFATLAGVSKVGTYTGAGATQTINCDFTGGARWVMIKRTDSTGNWWVWDTATGMVAGNNTRIAINETAQIINQNWVYTIATGFQIVTTNAEVNASGGTYIYLAIA